MNKHNIHEYWHLLEAMKAGKDIEYLDTKLTWVKLSDTCFDLPVELYRVNPEPLVRYKNKYSNRDDNRLTSTDYKSRKIAVEVGNSDECYIKTIKMVEEV